MDVYFFSPQAAQHAKSPAYALGNPFRAKDVELNHNKAYYFSNISIKSV